MSTKGVDNWNKHWKGSNKTSVAKKPGTIYVLDNGVYKMSRALELNVPITYIDNSTNRHDKISFVYQSDPNSIYYTHIDNFVKPGRVDITDYSPESFGLTNRYFNNINTYYTEVKKSIDERWYNNSYSGELYEYLIQLLEYSKGGVSNFLDIDYRGFPWGSIISYFTEVIGPIACIYGDLLSQYILDPDILNSRIYIPPTSETAYDFKIISDKREYKVSVKSARGVSNQVKPQIIIGSVDHKLDYRLKNSVAYRLLKTLASNSVIKGPVLAWMEINPLQINYNMFADYQRYYNNASNYSRPITNLWKPFTQFYRMGENANYGNIRFKCETLIEELSKIGQINKDLKDIFKVFLDESRIMYFSMNISPSSPRPYYRVIRGSVIGGQSIDTINDVYIRNSNTDSGRVSDRMGYTVQ